MNASEQLGALADEVWRHHVERAPLLQLRHGIQVEHIPTGTIEEAEADAAFARGCQGRLAGIHAGALGDDDRLTLAFLRDLLATEAEAAERWWWHFACTPYQLYALSVAIAQIAPTVVGDEKRGRAIAADYAAAVGALERKVALQADRGWRIPRPALGGAIAAVSGLRMRAGDLFPGDAALPAAFDALLDALAGDYAEAAPEGVGLAQYPGGEAAYRRLLAHHATFSVTPEEVHELGLDQVAELTERMAAVRGRLGFAGSEAEFLKVLDADGRLYARTPAEVEARYREAILRIEPILDQAFRVLPRARYDVERLDASLEAGMTYGYYEFPTAAQPVGRYRYNGSGLDTRSQLSAATIIYHELVPGHHFHVARQTENQSLPSVRRDGIFGVGTLSAYTEGWAEYAAHVAGELGMYADPYDEYGRLVHERFVAQRLVLDTGLNGMGWSLERARSYMREMTTESDEQVATETLRYATDLPGQAVAYRLGDLKFRELRDAFRVRRGTGFDVRDFHELVLAPGALPMTVLEAHLEEMR